MESGTFLDEKIQKAFRRFVEIRIHTDNPDAKLAYEGKKLQRQRFGQLTQPYYAILDPSGKKVYWSKGGVMDVGEFLAGLHTAPQKKQDQ